MKNHLQLRVQKSSPISEIYIGNQVLSDPQITEELVKLGNHCVILADMNVIDAVKEPFASLNPLIIPIPPGEASKSRMMKAQVEDRLINAGIGRDSYLIAVGGGVVTDLGGFVAATFCRGIPLVLVPTTLLAMCDAAVGGKTGINHPKAKNLIGSFYFPQITLMDLRFLATLKEDTFRSGMSEVLKHALIADREFYEMLLESKERIREDDVLLDVVTRNVKIKRDVVERDTREKGLRRIVNFGHTIGHAIETLENYEISHGDAIAIGMITEAHLSRRCGFLSKEDFEKVDKFIRLYDFPLIISSSVNADMLREIMSHDKKAESSKPRFVMLETIGKTMSFNETYCYTPQDEILTETLDYLIKTFVEKT